MYTTVDDFETQGFMRTMGEMIVDDGVGSDLDAFVAACPILGFSEQLLAYTAMTVILGNVPTLDVAHGL
jgi:ABC-type glucose/galactose transport system permease subunit